MEIIEWLGNHVLSLVLGFVGGWGYHRYRLLKIKRYAPSAKVVSFHVALEQHHYDRLPKKEDDVMYSIVGGNDPKGSDHDH